MQSRAVREGSVGLMLLAGLGVFGAIVLWLRGMTPGTQTYNIVAQFEQAPGIQPGGGVRFRGIKVGKIAKIEPGINGVDVTIQMDDPNLVIPKDVGVEVTQTGLIGEPVVEITPRGSSKIDPSKVAKAMESNCDRNTILCNNAKITGQIGPSFNELLRRATKLVDRYEDPQIVNNLNQTLIKAGAAAEDISKLSRSITQISSEFSRLPKSVESGLNNISLKVNNLSSSIEGTTAKFGTTADKFSQTADQLNITAAEYKKLAVSVNGLVVENRKTFGLALDNFNKLSVDLRTTVTSLNPSISKLNATLGKVNSDKLVKDLESVLSNANQASQNLKSVSANLNDPKALSMLQQTLDSARVTFQNTQKITADLDDLTGNPEFRANLRQLVNGLGKLVSSGEQMEQQVKLAQTIEPMGKNLDLLSKQAYVPDTKLNRLNPPTDPTDLKLPILPNPQREYNTRVSGKPSAAPTPPPTLDIPQPQPSIQPE